MGGGASAPTPRHPDDLAEQLMADRPIVFKPLQVDGSLGHMYDPATSPYRSQPKPHDTDNIRKTVEAARDLRANELLVSGPICPSCARGDSIGQPCKICGKVQGVPRSSPTKVNATHDDHVDAMVHLIMDAEALKRRASRQHEHYDHAQRKRQQSMVKSGLSASSKEMNEGRKRALAVLSRISAQRAAWYADDDVEEQDQTSTLKSGSLLPEVRIVRKKTTCDSISLAWDADPAAKTAVNAIKSLSAGKALLYNLEYRAAKDESSPLKMKKIARNDDAKKEKKGQGTANIEWR
jgi:hypothetical protein